MYNRLLSEVGLCHWPHRDGALSRQGGGSCITGCCQRLACVTGPADRALSRHGGGSGITGYYLVEVSLLKGYTGRRVRYNRLLCSLSKCTVSCMYIAVLISFWV